MAADVTITEVPAPLSVDDANRWLPALSARLWELESEARHGHRDLAFTEAAAVAISIAHAGARRRYWSATVAGEPVGVGSLRLTLEDNVTVGNVDVIVRPDVRRRGIGSALLAAIHAAATEEGRTTLQGWDDGTSGAEPGAPGAIEVRSQTGWIDATGPAAAFAIKHGYVAEQLEVHSVLEVPVAAELADRLRDDAEEHASGYDLVGWSDDTPDEFLDGLAVLLAAMIDAPIAELDYEEEIWDADRVRTRDARYRAAGMQWETTAAIDRTSGELAAFTVLEHQPERAQALTQDATLVLRPHRGHRLGMLVKVANLRRAEQRWPGVRRIHTWNADENDHMLSINRALGFRPTSVEVAWQRRQG